VLQMRGGGYADVLPVLQVPDNKADAVPCERLPILFDLPGKQGYAWEQPERRILSEVSN